MYGDTRYDATTLTESLGKRTTSTGSNGKAHLLRNSVMRRQERANMKPKGTRMQFDRVVTLKTRQGTDAMQYQGYVRKLRKTTNVYLSGGNQRAKTDITGTIHAERKTPT